MHQTQNTPTDRDKDREKLADFLLAAQNGDADFVREAIEKGADPLASWPGTRANARSRLMDGIHKGDTALLVAARHGHRQLAESLIPISNLFARNALGVTLLMSAALGGDGGLVSVILRLLDDEAVTARSNSGLTALGLACDRRDTQILRVLLADGRLSRSSTEKDESALAFAFRSHAWGCVAALAATEDDRLLVASMLKDSAARGATRSLAEAVEELGDLAPIETARVVASNPSLHDKLPRTLARIEACALADVVATGQLLRSETPTDDSAAPSAEDAAVARRIQRI